MTSLEYQQRADYCRRRARDAATADLRTRWLMAAEAWVFLAIDHEPKSWLRPSDRVREGIRVPRPGYDARQAMDAGGDLTVCLTPPEGISEVTGKVLSVDLIKVVKPIRYEIVIGVSG